MLRHHGDAPLDATGLIALARDAQVIVSARRPDVIATPHIGGLTPAAVRHQAFDTVAQVAAIAAGRMPPGAVNPDGAARLGR